jgi:predicted lipoprotein with Yx(FWY)xxD motif
MKRAWSRVLVGGGIGRVARRGLALLAVAMIVAAALSAASASALVYYPPRLAPAVRTAEGFELKGTVYNYGGTTTYHFEYGTTTAYGTSLPMPDADAGSALATPVSQTVTGLAPETVYHYRLVSTNSVEGTGFSEDGTFSTVVTTAPVQAPPTTAPQEAAPAVGGSGPKTVAKALHLNGRTLLTTTAGRTLYSLSAEKHGKFVCTEASGCTGIWHPLTVAAGITPKGPAKLGTIKRPEGTTQVTYRGLPLYTFAGDKKRGQMKGDGLKDVGTWHPATVSAPKSPSTPAPSPGAY